LKNPLRLKNFGLTVEVENGNVEKALRKFKKKVNNDGKIQEVRNRQEFVKPSTKKKLARSAAKKRWQKQVQSTQMPKKLY